MRKARATTLDSDTISDRKRVEKYRALLAPHGKLLAERAFVFARALGRRKPPA
jgi:hypothetical protein